jgi:hypothetical protein
VPSLSCGEQGTTFSFTPGGFMLLCRLVQIIMPLVPANQRRAFGMTLPPPGIASCAPFQPSPTPS